MTRLSVLLLMGIVGLAVLNAAGPALAKLAHAAVPLVITVGVVVLIVRAVWYFTSRW